VALNITHSYSTWVFHEFVWVSCISPPEPTQRSFGDTLIVGKGLLSEATRKKELKLAGAVKL